MTGRNRPGFCRIWLEQIEETLAAAHLLMEGRDERARTQTPVLPQGVFSTTSSRLAQSA